MVIAHVIDSMETGGAEMVVAALCRSHMAAGHRVEVHCLIAAGPLADELRRDGIPVYVHARTRPRRAGWMLLCAMWRTRPDVVHCHNKTATIRAAAIARLVGSRAVISTRHGLVAPPWRLRRELKFWIAAAMFCDRVVAVCDSAWRNMTSCAPPLAHRILTIRNGAAAASVSDQCVPAASGFTLISVGRLVPAKSFDTLIRAVAEARAAVPDLRLWIVGAGDEGPSLERLCAELGLASAVRFFGEQRDVGSWLRAADVFVLSSISEGLPIALLEAMAAGLPAIVTDVGGLTELLALSGAGTTVPVRDVYGLAHAIVQFAHRRHELEALGKRAVDCYETYFTPDRMAREYLSVYRACLGCGAVE